MAGSSHMTRWKRRWRSRNQIPRKHSCAHGEPRGGGGRWLHILSPEADGGDAAAFNQRLEFL